MQDSEGIELSWIFKTLRRWWWLIFACTLLVGMSVFVVTRLITPKFEASTTLLIDPAKDVKTSDYNLLIAAERQALTYGQMLKSQPILQEAASKAGLKDIKSLASNIDAEPIPNTQLIRLTVKDTSPEQAAFLANTISQVFTQYIQRLQKERYSTTLNSIQEQVDTLSKQAEETQSQLEVVIDKKVLADANLTRQQHLVDQYLRDYQTLQQDYQDLQLTTDKVKTNISVVEAAKVPDEYKVAPFTADITILLPSEDLAQTYGFMLTGRSLLESAVGQFNLSDDAESLAKRVELELVRNTPLVKLYVRDNDRTRATQIAAAIAAVFVNQIQALVTEPYTKQLAEMQTQISANALTLELAQNQLEQLTTESSQAGTEKVRLENQLNEYRSSLRTMQQEYDDLNLSMAQAADSVVVTEPAEIPKIPTQNNLLYIILASLVGLSIGVGAAFLFESLDDTIKTAEDISKKLGLSTIGTIGVLQNGERGLVVEKQPRSPSAEAFRVLAANIRYSSLDKPLKTLLVTSPHPQAGKTLVAANLAAAISQTESSVIAVDADLRLPTLHKLFEIENGQGLTESILKNSVDGNLNIIRTERLSVLTCGDTPPNPTEVIGSQRMHSILHQLTKKATVIVFDSCPLLVAADAKTLATQVDGVILVLRSGQTATGEAREALESLRQVNAKVLGAVLNGERRNKESYYYYHYHDGLTRPVSRRQRWLNKLKHKVPRIAKKK